MTNHRNRFPARRRFLKQSAALSARAATLAAPAIIAQTFADPAATDGDAPVDPTPVRAPDPARGAPSNDSAKQPESRTREPAAGARSASDST